MNISNFIEELRRRNVIKVATAYAIAGWLIIQISTSVFPAFEFPNWTTQFVIILVGIGFPLTLIFAWAFELTPEGIKKSAEVEITKSVTTNTGKKLNGVIITVLSMAVVFLLVERVFFAKANFLESQEDLVNSETASIAVLPFVNMSGDTENEYFSDGLSEELLNGLAKLEDIQVAGRTSSFQFKGSNPDLRDVGTQLGVRHILEGSVRKSGNRVRITAQLIQADNGFHLWSETYDRELTASDVFNIQEEITRQVVAELKVRLLPEEEEILADRPTEDIEAYNAFLEATQSEITRQPDDIEYAIEKYKEAIRIDPTFSLAYARLAYSYNILFLYGNIPLEVAKEETRKNIDQALTINGNEGKAYQAMASYYRIFETDYEQAEKAATRAVELLPNDAMALNQLQIVYNSLQKVDEYEKTLEKAYELDPLSPIIASNYVGYLRDNESFEEALNLLDDIIERDPSYRRALSFKANILANPPYGNIDEAFKFAFEAYKFDRKDRSILTVLESLSDDVDLPNLSDYFENEIKINYPDNSSEQIISINNHYEEGRYDSAEIEIEIFLSQFGEELRKDWHVFIADIYYRQGRIEDAITLYERYNPEFLDDELILTEFNYGHASVYLKLNQEVSDFPREEQFLENICSFTKELAIISKEENKTEKAFYEEVWCDLIRGNQKVVVEAFESIHFDKKNKRGWIQFFEDGNFMFKDFVKTAEAQEAKKRIFADLHIMRDNIIAYLKAEREWREEWGITE